MKNDHAPEALILLHADGKADQKHLDELVDKLVAIFGNAELVRGISNLLDLGREIDSLRRNLQREHVKRLAAGLVRPSSAVAGVASTARAMPMMPNRLPRREVSGLDRPPRLRMNRMVAPM